MTAHTWTDTDRQRLCDAAMDIANMVAAGLKPKKSDIVTFRWLQTRRDAWLEEVMVKRPEVDRG